MGRSLKSLGSSEKKLVEIETEADYFGALYGHIAGTDDLYRVLAEAVQADGLPVPEILLSHPLTDDRRTAIAALADARGWPGRGETTPLPESLVVSLPEESSASD